MPNGIETYKYARNAAESHIKLLYLDDEIKFYWDEECIGDIHKIFCKKKNEAKFRLIFVPFSLNGSVFDTNQIILVVLENHLPEWTIVAHIRSHIEESKPTLAPIMKAFCAERCKNSHCALQGQAF